MSWPDVEIKQVARVVGGATPKSNEAKFWDGDVAWATPKDLSDLDGKFMSDTPRKITNDGLRSCSAEVLPTGSVLFSSRAPIGHVAVNTVPMATNQGFKSFIPGPDLDASFLYWWLDANRARLQAMGNGATFKEVSKAIVERIKIPLPPLPEQRRIAGILDQADALRRLRRRSLSRLSDLGQAIFHEMFGDTNQDSSSAYNAKVGDVCFVSSGSTPSRKVESYYGGSIPWVKTTEVKGGPISSVEEFITEAGRAAARLKTYPVKTILVAMYGQGRTRGNVGYLTFPATVNQACAALQCNESCIPEFMFFQLKSSYERLRRLGQGGNQPNLNAEIVRSFPIVLPTIERQSAFLKIFNDIRGSENHMRDHEKQADNLFASLQHRAFRGEL